MPRRTVPCVRAGDETAALHGNPARDRLLPYGDTPLGTYQVRGIIETGAETSLPESAFGPHGALVLEPVAGEAALAEASGRFVLLIHGGARRADRQLVSTQGCLRLSDADMHRLVAAARGAGEIACEIVEAAAEPDAMRVRCEGGEGGWDPPPVHLRTAESERVGVAARLSRRRLIQTAGASAGAAALRSLFGAFPLFSYLVLPEVAQAQEYGGTHIEFVDKQHGVQVRNGYHLEHDDQGRIVEVPDPGSHTEHPAPERPAAPEPPAGSEPPSAPPESPSAPPEHHEPHENHEPHEVDHPAHGVSTAPTPTPATPVPAPVPAPRPAAPANPPAPQAFRLLDNAILPPGLQPRIARIAERFTQATGRTLQVTSGFRTPATQATAMFDKIIGGEDPYGNSSAFQEILAAFESASNAGKTRAQIEAQMATVISAQTARGVFISRHLTGRAVDVRTKDLSPTERAALENLVRMEGGTVIHEGVPPHMHWQF